jgi:alkylation response protein AidB-like acyl-CoA dehydrogenase
VADEAIYSCLQMLEVMDIWKSTLARLFRDSRLGPIGGGTSEYLGDIIKNDN